MLGIPLQAKGNPELRMKTLRTIFLSDIHLGTRACQAGRLLDFLREHDGISLGDIRVMNDCVHEAADGRRYLVVHGDAFDQVTRYHRWLAVLGDYAYNCGDWVDSCTAVVEHDDGRMEVVHWGAAQPTAQEAAVPEKRRAA